jgi:hypothetical protein
MNACIILRARSARSMEEDASLRRPEGTTVNCGTRKAAYETPIHPSLIARVPSGASSPAFDAMEARSECETLPQSRLSQARIVCVGRVNLAAACDLLDVDRPISGIPYVARYHGFSNLGRYTRGSCGAGETT